MRRSLAAAVHGARWDPSEVVGTLLAHVPEDDPAWEALLESSERTTATAEPYSVTWGAMRLRLAIEMAELDLPQEKRPSNPDEIAQAAEERIWTVPMVTPHHPRATRGGLLVLTRAGDEMAPAFQLDEQGRVLGAAAEVNMLLDADDDPWGVASWWLTPHAGLHVIPADALRVGDGQRVIAAALAAGDGD
ncbi:MAG TPA: hypothetical protein VF715_02545 [Thermoleophilaceae bacterium]